MLTGAEAEDPPFIYRCAYCDRLTSQGPGRVQDVVYPPCCRDCIHLWRSTPVATCTPEVLAAVAAAHPRCQACVDAQWAYDTICEERFHGQRPGAN
jgi:hypothetical protein